MKKLKLAAVIAAFVAFGTQSAFAASVSTNPINVKASVLGGLTLTWLGFQPDGQGNDFAQSVTEFDFGQLVEVNGELAGSKYFMSYLTANTHGDDYVITRTSGALTNGTANIPDASYTATPVYVASDNGGTTDGTIGSAGTAHATDKVVYTSSAAGPLRTVRDYVAVTHVPLDQQAGNYATTIVYTLTA